MCVEAANSSMSGGDFLKQLSNKLICANFMEIIDISLTFPKYLANNKAIVFCNENAFGSQKLFFKSLFTKPASGVANVNIPGSAASIVHAFCPNKSSASNW